MGGWNLDWLAKILEVGGPLAALLLGVLGLIGLWIWKVAPVRAQIRAEETQLKLEGAKKLPDETSKKLAEGLSSVQAELASLKERTINYDECATCKQETKEEIRRIYDGLNSSTSRLEESLDYVRNRLDQVNDHLISLAKHSKSSSPIPLSRGKKGGRDV